MSTFDFFRDLGTQIERVWSRSNNDEAAFPELATRLLEAADRPPFSAMDLLREVAVGGPMPLQADVEAAFGQPPVTVFRSRDFFISVLFWFDSTTAVHEHRFSGAFRVWAGSSIHSSYEFGEQHRMNSHLLFGDLEFQSSEHLRQDEVRPILPGDQGIHALFHLEEPSATIVVRTYTEEASRPQYNHLRPGVAYDPDYHKQNIDRAMQSLEALHRVDPSGARAVAHDIVSSADALSGFILLRRWARLVSAGDFEGLLEAYVGRHGGPTDMLVTTFEEQRREQGMIQRRRLVTDPRHRVLLALLLNLPDRANVESLLAAIYPGAEPRRLLAELLREMASKSNRTTSGLVLGEDELALIESAILADEGDFDGQLRDLSSRIQRSEVLRRLLG